MQSVVPQASGECSKVKVKVRVNVHGVFSVSSASLVEMLRTSEGEEPMEMDHAPKEDEVSLLGSSPSVSTKEDTMMVCSPGLQRPSTTKRTTILQHN